MTQGDKDDSNECNIKMTVKRSPKVNFVMALYQKANFTRSTICTVIAWVAVKFGVNTTLILKMEISLGKFIAIPILYKYI